jgi:hypothetical protein
MELVRNAMAFASAIEIAEIRAKQVGFRGGVTLTRALLSGLAARLESDDHLRCVVDRTRRRREDTWAIMHCFGHSQFRKSSFSFWKRNVPGGGVPSPPLAQILIKNASAQ